LVGIPFLAVPFVLSLGCQKTPPPPAIEPTPLSVASLPNAFRVSERIYSGGNPDDERGFAALAKLGVKTAISVDGARPDVETARRFGIRYVHLPFGYDGIPKDRIAELAKCAATMQGPLYIHCHHGKHRGPAAVAAIQLCNDPTWDAARAKS
jgi:protein tyrosine phosphatase (PTP) superfamily phosphohydrolase (DUF442 family)